VIHFSHFAEGAFQSGAPLTITANNTAGLFNPLTRPNTNGKDPRLGGKQVYAEPSHG